MINFAFAFDRRIVVRLAAIGLCAALPAAMPAASFLLDSAALSFAAVMNNSSNLVTSATGVIGSIGIGNGTLQMAGGCSGNCQVTGVIDFSTALNSSSGGYSVPTGDSIGSGITILHGTADAPSLVSAAVTGYQAVSTEVTGLTGTNLDLATIANGQVIQATSGVKYVIGGVTTYVFTITNGAVANPFTVSGSSSVNVVFNYAGTNLNFANKSVSLSGGMNGDQLIWNLTSSGTNVLTSSGTAATNVVNGAFLLPNGTFNLSGITLDGLVYGGNSSGASHISSTSVVDAPTPAPEPASFALIAGGMALLGFARLRRRA